MFPCHAHALSSTPTASAACGDVAAEGGVKVAPAPNPSDVVWEHLEIPRGKRQRAYVRNA